MGKGAVSLRLAQELDSRCRIEFKTILSYNSQRCAAPGVPLWLPTLPFRRGLKQRLLLERAEILWLQNLLVRSLDPILPRQL